MGNINSCWAAEPAETSSSCVMNTATAAHYFTVPNYSLLKGMGVGKFVSSRTFSVGGHKWKVRFYPDGNKATGHAAAFLCLCSGVPAAGVHTKFTLSLLVNDGKVHTDSKASSSCLTHTFEAKADNTWGFTDFIEKSKLHENCFTIRCNLTVIKKPSKMC
ncbi:hypothetical protein ACQ4PT_038451 [Festuca glaucescens]